MATIKVFTDLPQSKKLAEILPIESADMCWYLATKDNPKAMFNEGYNKYGDFELPCWSLAALLNVIPEVSLNTFKDGNWNAMIQHDGKMIYEDKDNPIDACYELILKLNELNLL